MSWKGPTRFSQRERPPQFPDGSFSAAVDKGGLDALMGEDTEGSEAAGAKFLAEIARLLKPRKGSVYVCVTLAQAHVLSKPLQLALQLLCHVPFCAWLCIAFHAEQAPSMCHRSVNDARQSLPQFSHFLAQLTASVVSRICT